MKITDITAKMADEIRTVTWKDESWTQSRFYAQVIGYAYACKNEWSVDLAGLSSVKNFVTVATDQILGKDREWDHRSITRIALFDRVTRTFVETVS